MNDRTVGVITVVLGFCVVTAAVGGLLAWEPVNEGNVKVVTNFGAYKGEVLYPGPHWVNPVTQDTHSLSVRPQEYTMSKDSGEGNKANKDDSVTVLTNDGVKVDIDVTVRYRVDASNAGTFYQKYKTVDNAETVLIRPTVRSVLRTEGGDISTQYIYTGAGQDQMRDAVITALEPELKDAGLVLEAVQIRNVQLPRNYADSIEQKEIAKQKAEQAENEVVLAEKEKQKQIIRAQANAEEAVIRATAAAEAREIEAQAEANANRKISASIDDRLIQYEWVRSVDGAKIYYVPTGENGTPIILEHQDDA